MALDLVKRNNVELVKGVDRATTTTVSALRTAVIVAQALANQKLVLDQITALNTTTGNMIESTATLLKEQSGQVYEQAASSTVSVAQLQSAFDNIYATLDMISDYKIKALDSMQQTVNSLSDQVAKAKTYLDKTRAGQVAESMQSLDTSTDSSGVVKLVPKEDRARRARHVKKFLFAPLAALVVALAACSSGGGPGGGQAVDVNSPDTLVVIAGSELKDLEPYLAQIKDKTGVTISLQYSGTLAGIDRVNAGEKFDGAWFSQAKYFVLSDTAHRIKAQEKIMLSPVVLGVKQSKAKALGWLGNNNITWKDISAKAGSGDFTYAMTNPTSSNSGFSAVIGVASALAGTSDALQVSDVDMKKLKDSSAARS